MSAKMKIDLYYGGEFKFTFEKHPNAGTVNVYNEEGKEVSMFTNYEIGSDFDLFEKACREHLLEMFEE